MNLKNKIRVSIFSIISITVIICMSLFSSNLNTLNTEVKSIKAENKTIEESVQSTTEEAKEIDEIKSENTKLSKDIESLSEQNKELHDTIKEISSNKLKLTGTEWKGTFQIKREGNFTYTKGEYRKGNATLQFNQDNVDLKATITNTDYCDESGTYHEIYSIVQTLPEISLIKLEDISSGYLEDTSSYEDKANGLHITVTGDSLVGFLTYYDDLRGILTLHKVK